MGEPVYKLLFFFLFTSFFTYGQIVFKEFPKYQIKTPESIFFETSETRQIIPLNGGWNVYYANDKDKNKTPVVIPSAFQGDAEFVFEKSFTITPEQLKRNKFKLNFLGVNYTADVSVNKVIIYRHTGGEFPFSFDLPKDIIKTDRKNVLSVKLFYKPDAQNTIPVKQRFLAPKSYGGIFRDVYIQLLPNISIADIDLKSLYNPRNNSARVSVYAKVENKEFRSSGDTVARADVFSYKVSLSSPGGGQTVSPGETTIELKQNQDKTISQTIEIPSAAVWSPASPQSYTVTFELLRGGAIVDRVVRKLAIYSLTAGSDSLALNGGPFELNGVTYVPSFYEYGSTMSYELMERDIRLIKETGFNAIRFIKCVPHPYYLTLCERYGLLAFVEMPLNSIPGGLATDQDFVQRSRNYLTNYIKAYKKYSALAAFGLGSGYSYGIPSHQSMISDLAAYIKRETNFLTYVSFAGFDFEKMDNIDIYGVELVNKPVTVIDAQIKEAQQRVGAGRLIISGATYTVSKGNSDGYVNPYSYEAQAKFFEELIDYAGANKLAGYFINTMFDYRGDFATLLGGYDKDNIYHIGIAPEDRSTSRIAYKVIFAKLHNAEKVTIPIGNKKDDAPMVFIIFGIFLAILMGALVNSGRKFREDSSRALLRPYNFFADIRDQRLMSGLHSTFLAFVVAAVCALLTANLLYYLKESIFFEKFLLAFGSGTIIKRISYLAWNPSMSLLWLTIAYLIGIYAATGIIKAGSFFVRNRVYLSSAYFATAWAMLPMILLIPVGIVLYRVLSSEAVNIYVYAGLIVFLLWSFYRLMKGIYVIYDVNAGSVYFYSILLVVVVVGGILLYYEMKNSAVEYLNLVLRQYNILG